jgi:hypothetical protein
MVTILSVGQDGGLLNSRAAVLRQSKIEVRNSNFKDAIQALTSQRFDLVILCHTLNPEQMNEVGRTAHGLPNRVRVLQVMSDTRPYEQYDIVDVDDVSQSHPASLVDKVVKMLHHTDDPAQFRHTDFGLQDNS